MAEHSHSINYDEFPSALLDSLDQTLIRQPADALLLSGGVDSSLLAALDRSVPAFTVGLKDGSHDIPRAASVAARLGIEWQGIELSRQEAVTTLDELVYLKASYDPGLINDIATYKATRIALEQGLRRIRTGDAADTLFAGYTYLEDVPDFTAYLQTLIPHMTLSPTSIGDKLNARYSYPYLAKGVLDIALSAPYSVHTAITSSRANADFHNTRTAEKGIAISQRWGKILLRKAAELALPADIAWRTKTDLEYGSGMFVLEQELGDTISDSAMERLESQGRRFWNKFHAFLYTRYELMGLAPPEPTTEEYGCGWCGGGVITGRHHCSTCGAYPADTDIDKPALDTEA